MATDKSINIRQTQATESLAASIEAINKSLAAMEKELAGIKALLQPTKLQVSGQRVTAQLETTGGKVAGNAGPVESKLKDAAKGVANK